MTGERLSHYTQLVNGGMSGCAVAMCWAVVQPAGLEDVVRRLGGDPDDLEVLGLDAAYEIRDGHVLHVDQVPGGVTVFEANGFQGSRAAVLAALSAGARVHSAFWNVNADSALSFAEDGTVVAALDGLAPARRHGAAPDALDADLGELYEALATPGTPMEAGLLAVVERRTGVRLDAAWLARDHEAIVIPR